MASEDTRRSSLDLISDKHDALYKLDTKSKCISCSNKYMRFTSNKHTAETTKAILGAFPSSLSDDVHTVLKILAVAKHEVSLDTHYSSYVHVENIVLPYRVYFPPISPKNIQHLTMQQRSLVAAIMTRHHDGFQREIWISELCAYPVDWAVPFIVYALGDYVVEVQQAIERSINTKWLDLFHDHLAKNGIECRSLSQRILTYWTEYYRTHDVKMKWLKDYPGFIAATKLGVWDKNVACKLLRRQKRRFSKETGVN